MTTPAKPERPESRLAFPTDPLTQLYVDKVRAAIPASAAAEADKVIEALNVARSEEVRLTELLERAGKLSEALAHELGLQIEARLTEEQEAEDLTRDLDALLGLGPTEQVVAGVERVVAERDAAREEAERLKAEVERLRAQMFTMKPDLGYDDDDCK